MQYPLIKPIPLPTTKEILKLFRLRAIKQLSQNFLLNPNIINKFVRHAGDLYGAEVCEVGPGPGGITRSIIEKFPSKLILVEKDLRFKSLLEDLKAISTVPVETYYDDVLKFDMTALFSESNRKEWSDEPPQIFLVGNLPFNVSTPLIIKWLKDISYKRNAWSYGRVRMALTFQDEVATRIVSKPSAPQRCRISVMCQNWCKVIYRFRIGRKNFIPSPKVHCGVVTFEPLPKPMIDADFELIEKVVRTAFNARQKQIKNNFKNLFPEDQREDLTQELFNRSGVNPLIKPYQLNLKEFGKLISSYKAICDRDTRLLQYNYRDQKLIKEFKWKIVKEEEETIDENDEFYVSSQYNK